MRPRLFLAVLAQQTRRLLSYRADFWLHAVVSFATHLILAVAVWRAIFAASGRAEIGGLTYPRMVVYSLAVVLVGRLVRGEERQHGIAQDIYEGHLTRYLLYPTPYVGMKYAEHLGSVGPGLLQAAAFALVVAPFLPAGATDGIDLASVAGAALLAAVGSLVYFLVLYLVQAVAFWADNVWSLNVTVRFSSELLGGLLLPLSVFPEGAQRVLGWLPFPSVFYWPVRTLLGDVGLAAWTRALVVGLGWCVLLAVASHFVWRRGYRSYSGVGI